ncbi:MAG: cytochrome c biogenesis CcdA family protein [Ruoffia tabacinasalis]|uniref:Cytochrome C biogenesis protein CcdA n=1 Tax=Ruoffia tabacinasalis TaxID=87458 RepID=A0A5R9DVK5_9LACT|nr:cytochrome c biogenesis protein CcdA [Ruoffia tabacinasalis]MBG9978983.1 cytochrome C biogenesis protein CcdA [Ruoffia tabacinasalis]TLQ40112.1 cytochrome C biogenesis protein CcdA [Ruoffia tabacinasalis]HJG47543.1 cytochrome c biogenesis protein CcdA [Ruoffia tabacinasalis]
MQHLLLGVEGVLTFISPCLLPMLPIYIAYLTGQTDKDSDKQKTSLLLQAIFFVLGFTIVFILMGIFVTTIGRFVLINRTLIHFIAGSFMILLGIDYLFGNPVMNRLNIMPGSSLKQSNSFVFGMIFSLTWTPCVGTFLASALSYAATSSSYLESVTLLLSFSFGLGIPFILSALLLNEMNHVLTWIKQHYRIIQTVSALFLIVMGISTMFGWLEMALIYLS